MEDSYFVREARFLIGRSGDVSLQLPQVGVLDKHCTLEKISVDKWIVECHDRASIERNEEPVKSGFLKCGDLLRITSQIVLKFECALSDCATCVDGKDIPGPMPIDAGRSSWTSNPGILPTNKRLLSQGPRSLHSAFKIMADTFRELLKVTDNLEKHQYNMIKLLNEMDTIKTNTIAKLQEKLVQQSAAKGIGSRRYNFRETTTTASQMIDETDMVLITSVRCKEIAKQLSIADSELEELKHNREKLTQALDKRLSEIEEMNPSMENPGVCRRILDGKNEDQVDMSHKLTELVQNEFSCGICQDILIETVVTNCKHMFCKSCLTRWEKEKAVCPLCRGKVRPKDMNGAVIDKFLNKLMPFISKPVMQNWQQALKESQALKLSSNPKKRKHNSGDHITMRRTLVVNLDEDSLDESSPYLNSRNGRYNMGPSSNVPRTHVTVVDLTEDDLD